MITILEQGQDHGLLLRQPISRQDTQAQVRGVWLRVQEGGLLGVQNQITYAYAYAWMELYICYFVQQVMLISLRVKVHRIICYYVL